MKSALRACGLCVLLLALPAAWGQLAAIKVSRIDIKHVGPAAVSDELIRANIRVRVGDPYLPTALDSAVDDDVRSLYGTGLFYNIQVARTSAEDGGIILTYVAQANPRLTDLKLQGNKKLSDSKIKKKITSKVGEPLSELKLFTDCQAIQELYQKSGYPGTVVSNIVNIDESAGRGTATFQINESPKIKITRIEFVGAQAFSQRMLRKQIKTRNRWMFSWLTGSGVFKEDQFEDDRDKLATFYRDRGYIDFEWKDVEFLHPTPNTMIIRIHVYEGRQYKVGAVTFQGTTMFPTNEVNTMLKLKPGAVFAPGDLAKDTEKVEDFYGAKGHIDVTTSTGNLRVKRIANTDTGTMDLQYEVDEGQPSYVEKIEIRGNTKTKDKVIRRELAISPGEVFDMVRVKVSKQRLEGLQFFEKVDVRPEPTDIANHKNLVVGVEEKNTGNLTFGAGFSSVDALVGYTEVSQGNFDLFHPPTFTGAGQKCRLRVQLGTQRQDYELSFVEPWFLGRKLSLGVDLYHRDLNFLSVNNEYDETQTGARFSLTRALGSDFLIGGINYTIEDIGINLNSGFHGELRNGLGDPGSSQGSPGNPGGGGSPGSIGNPVSANVPNAILSETGSHLLSRFGTSLAYDTENSTYLPDAGQRTEFSTEVTGGPLGGDKEFYKLELKTAWYLRGLIKGHVLEIGGRTGVADGFGSGGVPFYERWYLGGADTLRGYRYNSIGPREPGFSEPIGGNTYWFGSAEYSIPIFQQEKEHGVGARFAVFYDAGSVAERAYSYGSDYDDNWGFGIRLNLPIAPLRLDYGIPIHHDKFNGGSGRFQFTVGYKRAF